MAARRKEAIEERKREAEMEREGQGADACTIVQKKYPDGNQ
jgi:hypothetical protein